MGSEEYMNKKIIIMETSESWMFLNNSKKLWYELVENWILMWTLCPVIGIPLYTVLKDNTILYRSLVLIVPVWIITLIRRKVKYLSLFMLFNIIAIVFAYFIGQALFEKIVYASVMIILWGNSIKQRYREIVDYYNINGFLFYEAVLSVCYIISFSFSLTVCSNFTTMAGIIVALSSALYLHITRTEKLMEWEKDFAQKFNKRLKRIKIIFSSVVVFIISGVIWILWKVGILEFLDRLQSNINSIFILRQDNSRPMLPKPKTIPKSQSDTMEGLKILEGDVGRNIFLEIIMKLIEIVIIILVIIILIYLFWKLVIKLKEIYYQFYERSPKYEKREFVFTAEDFKRTIVNEFEKRKRAIGDLFDRSNERKIRRLYKKSIETYRDQGVEIIPSDTPEQMLVKVKKRKGKNLNEAVKLYNKARYSNYSCSDQEVTEMKRYL